MKVVYNDLRIIIFFFLYQPSLYILIKLCCEITESIFLKQNELKLDLSLAKQYLFLFRNKA